MRLSHSIPPVGMVRGRSPFVSFRPHLLPLLRAPSISTIAQSSNRPGCSFPENGVAIEPKWRPPGPYRTSGGYRPRRASAAGVLAAIRERPCQAPRRGSGSRRPRSSGSTHELLARADLRLESLECGAQATPAIRSRPDPPKSRPLCRAEFSPGRGRSASAKGAADPARSCPGAPAPRHWCQCITNCGASRGLETV
jgi:hypothetical protein